MPPPVRKRIPAIWILPLFAGSLALGSCSPDASMPFAPDVNLDILPPDPPTSPILVLDRETGTGDLVLEVFGNYSSYLYIWSVWCNDPQHPDGGYWVGPEAPVVYCGRGMESSPETRILSQYLFPGDKWKVLVLPLVPSGYPAEAEWDYPADLALPVTIDIKPGSDENPINLGTNGKGKGKSGDSSGTEPVAVLGTAGFDPHLIDVASVRLGDQEGVDTPVSVKNNGSFHASYEDVNGDGFEDLVVHFDRALLLDNGDITPDTERLYLTGMLTDGRSILGNDVVRPIF